MNCNPMLACEYKPELVKYPCYLQSKLNGIRAIFNNGQFITRDQCIWDESVVKHLLDEIGLVKVEHIALDGEMFLKGKSLQEINSAIGINRKAPNELTGQIEYHIFDCFHKNGRDIPFHKRYFVMREWLAETDHIKFVPVSLGTSKEVCDAHYEKAIADGYEGLIYRVGNNYYQPKIRSKTLLKRKPVLYADAFVVSVEQGKGRLAETMGALKCQLESCVRFNIGTGFSDEIRNRIWHDKEKLMELQPKLRFSYECLSADGVPLKPAFEKFL